MHDRVAAKKGRAMVTSPHWGDDKMLVTGKYEKDEFMARVMDHIADQYDGPVGSDPPTWDFPRMGAGSDKNLGGSSCMVKMRPKLPLHGTAKKKSFWGGRKTQEPKIP